MLARHADIPLHRDPSSRFLPWLIGLMVYLAALALAGALAVDAAVQRWDRAISSTLTVQILPSPNGADEARRIETVLGLLRDTPGVIRAETIASEHLSELLAPWLGTGDLPVGIPLPSLIDVEFSRRDRIDLEALSAKLARRVPGTAVDTHEVWLARLVALFRALELIAGLLVALVGAAVIATVVFSARAGLSVHRDAIELLHLIGAQDRYIAGQFSRQARDLGFVGGLAGLGGALLTLIFIGRMASGVASGLVPELSLGPWHWVGLALLPIGAALLTMLTAWLTVVRTLDRLM